MVELLLDTVVSLQKHSQQKESSPQNANNLVGITAYSEPPKLGRMRVKLWQRLTTQLVATIKYYSVL